jgi:hypothetical protein
MAPKRSLGPKEQHGRVFALSVAVREAHEALLEEPDGIGILGIVDDAFLWLELDHDGDVGRCFISCILIPETGDSDAGARLSRR